MQNQKEKILGGFKNIGKIFYELEQKIDKLNIQVDSEPLIVKNEIDKILDNSEVLENIKGNIIGIELLKIKAKAISMIGGLEDIDSIFNEITIILNEEYNFSDNKKNDLEQKRKLSIENLKYKIELISAIYWKTWDSNGKIIIETHNQLEKKLIKETDELKELGAEKDANNLLYNFYNSIGENKKAEKHIKNNTILGNIEDTKKYLTFKTESFLQKYKSIKTEEKKIEYKSESLLQIEKIFNDFIYYKGNKVTKYPEFFKDLGEFFEKVGEPKRALKEYENGIESEYEKSYILYGKIAELFFQNKLNLTNLKVKYVAYTKKEGIKVENILPSESEIHYFFISENFRKLIYYAETNKDTDSKRYGLVRMGDLVKNQSTYSVDQYPKKTDKGGFSRPKKSKDYYTEAISLFTDEMLYDEKNIHYFLELSDKLGIKLTQDELKFQEYILFNHNPYNILIVAKYYEDKGDFENAIFYYITGYKYYNNQNELINLSIKDGHKPSLYNLEEINKEKNLSDAFKRFLETKFKNKLVEEKELLILKNIIEKLDNKKKLLSSEVSTLFSHSLVKKFEKELTYEKLERYIYLYNENHYGANIYIQIILNTLYKSGIFNKKLIDKLLSNIYKGEKINKSNTLNDLKNSFDINKNKSSEVNENKINTNKKKLNTNEKFINLIKEYNNRDESYIYEIISFLENDLKEKVRKELSENTEIIHKYNQEKKQIKRNSEGKEWSKTIKHFLKNAIKNQKILTDQIGEIDELIKEIKNKKVINKENIIEIFNHSIDDNYQIDFDMKQLFTFTNIYNEKKYYGDLLLQHILLSLEYHFEFDNKKILEPFFNKIKNQKKLDSEDLSDLFDIFYQKFQEQENNKKLHNQLSGVNFEEAKNTYEYTLLLNSILNKSKK